MSLCLSDVQLRLAGGRPDVSATGARAAALGLGASRVRRLEGRRAARHSLAPAASARVRAARRSRVRCSTQQDAAHFIS